MLGSGTSIHTNRFIEKCNTVITTCAHKIEYKRGKLQHSIIIAKKTTETTSAEREIVLPGRFHIQNTRTTQLPPMSESQLYEKLLHPLSQAPIGESNV